MSSYYGQYLFDLALRDQAMVGLFAAGLMAFAAALVWGRELPGQARVDWRKDDGRLLIGILCLAFLVRLLFIGRSPLWYDETFSHLVNALGAAGILKATVADVHPPIYYFTISYLTNIRFYSVIWSMLAMMVILRLSGDMKMNLDARMVAFGLMAFLPVQVYYAQEGRMYAMLQCLVLLAFWSAYNRHWWRMAFFMILAMYTHNYGVIYSAVIGGMAILCELRRPMEVYRAGIDGHRRPLAGPLLATGAAFLAWLPWAAVILKQMSTIQSSYWIQPVTLGSVLFALMQLITTTVIPEWLVPMAGLSVAVVVAASLHYGGRAKRFDLLAMAFAPLILVVLASIIWRPVLLFRGLLPSIPFVILIIAEAVTSDRRAWLWAWGMAGVLVIALGSLVYFNAIGQAKEETTVQAFTVESGDAAPMYHLNDATLLPYLVYRPDLEHRLIDSGCPADPGALSAGTRAALGIRSVSVAALPAGATLAALVGPLSTRCEEDLYHQLTDQAQPLAVQERYLVINGVWQYER